VKDNGYVRANTTVLIQRKLYIRIGATEGMLPEISG